MNILHVIASVDPEGGGPIEGVLRQAEAWKRMGHELAIASLDAPRDPWVATCPVKTHALGVDNAFYGRIRRLVPWSRYGYTPHFVSWLRANSRKYNVIIVNGLWNYVALGSYRGLRGTTTPYFVFPHGTLDPWFRRTYPIKHLAKQLLWWFSEGRLLHGARAALFTSEEERSQARNAFWPYALREMVVGYGTADVTGNPQAQIAAFRAQLPMLTGRRFLLFLSRIHPKKGCDLLIRAFARQAALHPDLDLVIAGPDQSNWRRELEGIASTLGITGRIHWPGMLKGDVKWGAFRACEAFVLPSHQENFGVSVAEAMACARPVLITDKVNIWREVEISGAGLVSGDSQLGVDTMLARFFAPDCDRASMSAAARTMFLEKFEIELFCRKLVALLKRAVQK
jgi:glycosyltransferase involved in cell wall biosynthesis